MNTPANLAIEAPQTIGEFFPPNKQNIAFYRSKFLTAVARSKNVPNLLALNSSDFTKIHGLKYKVRETGTAITWFGQKSVAIFRDAFIQKLSELSWKHSYADFFALLVPYRKKHYRGEGVYYGSTERWLLNEDSKNALTKVLLVRAETFEEIHQLWRNVNEGEPANAILEKLSRSAHSSKQHFLIAEIAIHRKVPLTNLWKKHVFLCSKMLRRRKKSRN